MSQTEDLRTKTKTVNKFPNFFKKYFKRSRNILHCKIIWGGMKCHRICYRNVTNCKYEKKLRNWKIFRKKILKYFNNSRNTKRFWKLWLIFKLPSLSSSLTFQIILIWINIIFLVKDNITFKVFFIIFISYR